MRKLLFIIAAFILSSASLCFSKPSNRGVIKVEGGLVRGTVTDSMMVFKGIPFAAPPIGELRWKAPQPVIPWKGIREAKAFGNSPVSSMGFPKESSEDCLYLNVWSPAKSASDRLPVMVWIYGGGFSMGTSSFYNGEAIARTGVIVVTINYRVGKIGLFAHPELSAENKNHVSGNYGILDQIAALKWVQNNISGFGGDPSKVTIFGESAGGISVSMLAASPLAKGLFRGAISESGSSFGPIRSVSYPGENMKTLAMAEKEGSVFAESLGAKSIAELRAMDASAFAKQDMVTGGAWPIVDGYVIPDDQYKMYEAGNYNDVALLIGYNSDEGDSFEFNSDPAAHIAHVRARYEDYADKLLAAYPVGENDVPKTARDLGRDAAFGWGTWTWGRLQNQTGHQPVYMYYFDQPPVYPETSPKFGHRSPHGQDVDYVFQSLRNPSESDKALAGYMLRYWTNFVKYLNPNGDGNDSNLPVWPLFKNDNSKVMVLTGEKPHPSSVPDEASMWVLDKYYAWRRSQE
jgi:para-nitrobenzyl esterase